MPAPRSSAASRPRAGRDPLRRQALADAAPGSGLSRGVPHAGRSLSLTRARPMLFRDRRCESPISESAVRPGITRLASLTTFTDEARIAFDTLAERAAGLFSPVAPARRHRPVAGRQDGVHLRPRPQSHPWRPAAAVRGAEVGAHRARLAGRAARRRGAALPVRRPHRRAGRTTASGRIRPAPSPSCGSPSNTNSASGWSRLFSSGRLSVDIVDYPGEWLLDLPLLGKILSPISRARRSSWPTLPVRAELSAAWRALAGDRSIPTADADEMTARAAGREPSPPISRPASTISARCRPCRRAAS